MDLSKLVGGLDVDDIKSVVDFVRQHGSDMDRLVQLLRDLPDDAVAVLTQLPKLLRLVSDGMAQAGEQAGRAATALVGEDGKGGARRALAGAAHTMTSTRVQLDRVGSLLGGMAKELNEVGVPLPEPKYLDVMGFHVVAGVDVNYYRPLEGPSKKLADGADGIAEVVGDLNTLSNTLQDLSEVLGVVGDAMSALGQRLSGSGAQVRALVGGID